MRQYIGARYVPRFSDVNNGIWSNVYSYEPLTIVKNGNDYYTSKQSVPVGVAITNTDYWVKTGDYNGAISTLDQKIDAVDDRVSALYDLHNRVFILIGDSYGQGYTPNVESFKGWCKWVAEYITASGGTALYSNAYGAGFATEGNTWLTVLETNESNWSSYADKVTDVIFIGGSNDQEGNGVTTRSLQDGIVNTFNYVHQHYPNAKIKTGIFSAVYNQIISNSVGTYNQYNTYATSKGATFMGDLRLLATLPQNISSDNVHLTQAGYQLYSPYIFDAIVTGHCHFCLEATQNITVTLDTDMVASDARTVAAWVRISESLVEIDYKDMDSNAEAVIKLKSSAPQSNTLKSIFTQDMHIPVGSPNMVLGGASLFSVEAADNSHVIYHGECKIMANTFLWGNTRMRVFYPYIVTNLHRNDNNYIPYLALRKITYSPA